MGPLIGIDPPGHSTTIVGADNTTGFSSPFVRSFFSGMGATAPSNYNVNAAVLEFLGFYGLPNGILHGLTLTTDGATATLSEGYASIGGIVEVASAITALPLPGSGVTFYYWLSDAGIVNNPSGTGLVPDSLFVGSITNVSGNFVVSYDSVIYVNNGVSWSSQDEHNPPSQNYFCDYVQTRDGLYKWTLNGYVLACEVTCPNLVRSGQTYFVPKDFTISGPSSFTCLGSMFIEGSITWA